MKSIVRLIVQLTELVMIVVMGAKHGLNVGIAAIALIMLCAIDASMLD